MWVGKVDVGQDPAPLPGLLAGRYFWLPSCLSMQTAPIWERASLPTLQTHGKLRASPLP